MIEILGFICIKYDKITCQAGMCITIQVFPAFFDFQSKLNCYWEMAETNLLFRHPQQCGFGILSLEQSRGYKYISCEEIDQTLMLLQ